MSKDWWAVRMVSFSPNPMSSVTIGLVRYCRKVTRGVGVSTGPPSAKGSTALLGLSPAPVSTMSVSADVLAAGASSIMLSLKLSAIVLSSGRSNIKTKFKNERDGLGRRVETNIPCDESIAY